AEEENSDGHELKAQPRPPSVPSRRLGEPARDCSQPWADHEQEGRCESQERPEEHWSVAQPSGRFRVEPNCEDEQFADEENYEDASSDRHRQGEGRLGLPSGYKILSHATAEQPAPRSKWGCHGLRPSDRRGPPVRDGTAPKVIGGLLATEPLSGQRDHSAEYPERSHHASRVHLRHGLYPRVCLAGEQEHSAADQSAVEFFHAHLLSSE